MPNCVFEGCEEIGTETLECSYTLGGDVEVEASLLVCPGHRGYLTRGALDGLSLSVPPAVRAEPDPLAGFISWAQAGDALGTNWLMERQDAVALARRLTNAEKALAEARAALGAIQDAGTGRTKVLHRMNDDGSTPVKPFHWRNELSPTAVLAASTLRLIERITNP